MKEDDKIQKLDLSDEFLFSSAEKRYYAGDYLGALTILNKRAKIYDPSADVCALYGDIYEALELYNLCADSWFRFLDTCNEEDFEEGYEGLALAFLHMGNDEQSDFYLDRILTEKDLPEEEWFEPEKAKDFPRIVYSDDGSVGDPEKLQEGLEFIRSGELEKAREAFAEIPEKSADYAAASGLSALCTLLSGDTDGAAENCRKLLEKNPEDVSTLTTYCAVLGAQDKTEEAKEIGKRLAAIETDSVEDLFRIATALCETGLDEEAFGKLAILKKKTPNHDDVLWFYAVAAYRTGRLDEAISSLERLTTIYPRKAVAQYYLERMREEGISGSLQIGYFYRLPEEEYKTVAAFLLAVNGAKTSDAERLGGMEDIEEYIRLAFDQLDGRDEKLRMLAVKVAIKCRCDFIIRETLLDYREEDYMKLSILEDLTVRNEENSFGIVICNLYREFFTHKIGIGTRKRKQFLEAFAKIYAKYALLSEANEERLIATGEEVYRILEGAGAADFFEERNEMAAVIYREARLPMGERSIAGIASAFHANLQKVKEILNYLI